MGTVIAFPDVWRDAMVKDQTVAECAADVYWLPKRLNLKKKDEGGGDDGPPCDTEVPFS